MFSYLRKMDWVLLASVMMLVSFGMVILYSTSLAGGDAGSGITTNLANFWKQSIFIAVGVGVAFMIPLANYKTLSAVARTLYVASVVLLVAVLLFGTTVRGTTGWFGLGTFGVQPVEIVKVFLLVFLARFFSEYAREPGGAKRLIGSGIAVGILFLLVAFQPDFGSALLLLSVWGAMLLVVGVKRSHLVVMAVAVVLTAVVAWGFLLKPYQKDRISTFWDPESDPLGRGYNVTQSIIAIGSGGFFGKGLGSGSQSQLRFLPERQTDFIFAVLAEELGFIGVFFLIAVFCLFFYRVFRLALSARDDFTSFLVLGIAFSLAIEVFVNIGGNLRMLPVTGVTLPFVSYGGSSILSKFLMVGILQSVAVRR